MDMAIMGMDYLTNFCIKYRTICIYNVNATGTMHRPDLAEKLQNCTYIRTVRLYIEPTLLLNGWNREGPIAWAAQSPELNPFHY